MKPTVEGFLMEPNDEGTNGTNEGRRYHVTPHLIGRAIPRMIDELSQ